MLFEPAHVKLQGAWDVDKAQNWLLSAIAKGRLSLEGLITHRIGPEGLADADEGLLNRKEQYLGGSPERERVAFEALATDIMRVQLKNRRAARAHGVRQGVATRIVRRNIPAAQRRDHPPSQRAVGRDERRRLALLDGASAGLAVCNSQSRMGLLEKA